VQAVDVFYVKDMFGLKLHSQSKRDALQRKLTDAIERGTEGAMT
jgi:[protein-PII] uridylyltransferase